ncbi:MAG: tetratricopeptide repeat protein [Butyrivibrio sp.]|nr:tetratricopeptide repeat protein [Butyrivibrio sp.]
MRLKETLVCMTAVSILLSGCGSFGNRHNIDTGFSHIENHDYQKAIESFETAQAEGEDACLTHRGLGIAYLKTGEYAAGAEELLASLAADIGIVDDMDFDTNFYLAECYLKQGEYDKAKEVYDAILTLRPKDTNAHYLRGTAELAAGNHDDAYSDFSKAIALNSRDYTMMIMIYKSLAEYGYNDEAASILQKAIDNGSSFMTNYEKGQISFYLGNNADAQSYLEAANSEKDQDKEPVVLLLGQTGEKQGDYNYAISVYKNYLSEHPDSAEIYNQLGMCQIRQGDYDAAIISFESGLALEDKNFRQALLLNEITAKEYLGDFAGAKSMMTSFLESYPDDAAGQREMVFLETRVLP